MPLQIPSLLSLALLDSIGEARVSVLNAPVASGLVPIQKHANHAPQGNLQKITCLVLIAPLGNTRRNRQVSAKSVAKGEFRKREQVPAQHV